MKKQFLENIDIENEEIELIDEDAMEFPEKDRSRAAVRKKNAYKKRHEKTLADIKKERRFDEHKLKTAKNLSRRKTEKRAVRRSSKNISFEE